MLTILLHSSKTMKPGGGAGVYQRPALLEPAKEIDRYLKTLDTATLQQVMKISPSMAARTRQLIQEWSDSPQEQSPAIDVFLGDIYSGLQVHTFDEADRAYANEHLYILSGLYGVLRALDSIKAYRLEMAYRLPDEPYRSLYAYWGARLAEQLPAGVSVVNVSSVEYTKAVFPYMQDATIITPKFLTHDPQSGEPKFVTVHAKVARGAFAHWMIKHRISDIEQLTGFDELNYRYDAALSAESQPVFICDSFGGLGLSVREKKTS